MSDTSLQRQRFEYKYLTSEHTALQIRQFVESYLDVDRFGATQHNLSYAVHSIYLDSPDLDTYRDTINGNRNRYKLRIRYYDNGEGKPVYLEVKRRHDKVITKRRAIVHRESVEELVAGQTPVLSHLLMQTPEQLSALQYFCHLRNELDATPRTHVSYMREAYQSDVGNSIRVTFDRHVTSAIQHDIRYSVKTLEPVSVFGNLVILELKFTDRYPNWFQDIVQTFHLHPESAAKYAAGLVMLHYPQNVAIGNYG